jgi:phospholipid transport system substrate-binding protein
MKTFVMILGLCALPLTALAGPGTDTIKKGNEKFQDLLSKKVDAGSAAETKLANQLTDDMRQLFDVEGMVERALVDHWAGMKPAERKEVVDTLRAIIERAYVKQLRANFKYQVTYDGEEQKGEATTVKTTVKAERKGRPVAIGISYVLHQKGGKLRVYDVVTDDVSMLKNYRSQFNRIIAKEGVPCLLAKMRKKLAADDTSTTKTQ